MKRTATTTSHITHGARVEFDSEYGPVIGIVQGIVKDVGNGEPYAVVELDPPTLGSIWNVPLSRRSEEHTSELQSQR